MMMGGLGGAARGVPAFGKQASVNTDAQGEIKIKFTDAAKKTPDSGMSQFSREPSNNSKPEVVEFIATFAMTLGETQNFSMPLYSGSFNFTCIFRKAHNVSS